AQSRLNQAVGAADEARKRATAAAAAEAKASSGLEALSGQRARHLKALAALLSGPLAQADLTAVARFLDADGSSVAGGPPVADRSPEAAALAEVTTALRSRRSMDDAVRKAAAGLDGARRQAQAARDALVAVQ